MVRNPLIARRSNAYTPGLVSKRREQVIAEEAEGGYETEPELDVEEGAGTVGVGFCRQLHRCDAVMIV